MRTKLSEWADKTFGKIHVGDLFKLNEEVQPDKEGNRIRNITLGIKKYQGYKKSWTDEETLDRWKEELKQIIGKDILKLDIHSSEGNEINYVSGIRHGKDNKEEIKSIQRRIFAYQFTISIIKREKRP